MTLEDFETKRKRLIFRSWHRGTREMDLLMGSFAEANVPGMDPSELDLYEEILNIPDPDLYDWVSGQKTAPANLLNPVLERLLTHTYVYDSPENRDAGN